MWGGGAFKAKFKEASDLAKASVGAIATGVQKLGVAAEKKIEAVAGYAVSASQWVKQESAKAVDWVAQKGKDAVELGFKTAAKVGNALTALKDQFVQGVKSTVSLIACVGKGLASALIAPEVRHDPPPTTLAEAQAALENSKHRQFLAELAGDAYHPSPHVAGAERVMGADLAGLENAVFEDPESGFKAALYKKDGKYVLAFAGTEDAKDWEQNFLQGVGRPSTQYQQAAALTKQVKLWARQRNASLELTGHSLGGGLASFGALTSGVPATVFNAARLSQGTMDRYAIEPDSALVENNYVEGEILTGAHEHASAIGAVVGYPAGVLGAVSMSAFATYELGQPIGAQRSIPLVDEDGDTVSYFRADALERHGMEYVQYGIDQQVRDNEAAVQSFQGNR